MSPLVKRAQKVGVLGGGQLARMLVQEGLKMGLEMHVLSPSPNDPAAQVTSHWHKGSLSSLSDIKTFAKSVDTITIESEFIDTSLIEGLSSVYPKPSLIAEFSDRLSQKHWLERHKLPTSRFSEVRTKNDIYSFANSHHSPNRQLTLVLKRRRFGYDGYGTFVLQNSKKVTAWMRTHANELSEFIVEDFQKFRRELAFQVVLGSNGDSVIFPTVEWRAENSKCLWVKGPIRNPVVYSLAQKIIRTLRSSGYVGVFAVELFDTKEGLVINEIAPRVHNSGHYTLEASPLNQFNAHLRAVIGAPLPKKVILNSSGFAMLNLLGSSPPFDNHRQAYVETHGHLHWYGKSESHPGRKMGHVTALADTPEQALKIVMKNSTPRKKSP